MFIERLVLIGYTRINQNFLTKLEIVFTKKVQIIIGTNGSGKTSIKEQLSPLPPNTADFAKGGRKEFYGNHRGSQYVTISDFGEQGGHYFEKDGEILNNWGTALVQKALIKQEFGLTQEIFDVMVGTSKFTEMSAIERRDWVMFLSSMDINPLMAVFMDSKNKQRDAKSYLSKISERLKIEERNKVDERIIQEKSNELADLKQEFNYYSGFGSEVMGIDRSDLHAKKERILSFMDAILENIPRVPTIILNHGIKDIDGLHNFIIGNNARLEYLRNQHQKLMRDLGEINKVAAAKALLSSQGIDEIQARIDSLNAQIAEYDVILGEYNYNVENPKMAKLDFMRVSLDLRDRLFMLPLNQEMKFNSNALKQMQDRELSFVHRLNQIRENIHTTEHRIKHIDETDEIQCPECDHSFRNGIGKDDRMKLVEMLKDLRNTEAAVNEELNKDREFIKDCSAFIEDIKNIYRIMDLTPSNLELWQLIKAEEVFRNPTYASIELLDKHNQFLTVAIQRADAVELLNKENDILTKANESLNIVNESNSSSLSKIDEDIFNTQDEINKLEELNNYATNVYGRLKHSMQQIKQLTEYFDDFNLAYFKQLDEMRANFIKDVTFNIMKEVNFIEQELEQARVKNVIFRDVEKELEEAKATYGDFTVIVNNLSPNTGLIADLLNESINIFVETLNHNIEAVWTTDLKVKPCMNKKNDLDWKFPVAVENNAVRPDVKKTSTSQKDIINFAFQRAVTHHMQAYDYPIFADELGSSMDEQHRINMMHILGDFVESNHCSQLFLISHYAAFHEQFPNNETFLVNSKNIINMPQTYNQHVTIS